MQYRNSRKIYACVDVGIGGDDPRGRRRGLTDSMQQCDRDWRKTLYALFCVGLRVSDAGRMLHVCIMPR
jgi:hypothetical protein